MKANFRNMWSRMPLTNSDVQTFYGMLRQLLRTNKKVEIINTFTNCNLRGFVAVSTAVSVVVNNYE